MSDVNETEDGFMLSERLMMAENFTLSHDDIEKIEQCIRRGYQYTMKRGLFGKAYFNDSRVPAVSIDINVNSGECTIEPTKISFDYTGMQ